MLHMRRYATEKRRPLPDLRQPGRPLAFCPTYDAGVELLEDLHNAELLGSRQHRCRAARCGTGIALPSVS